MNYTDEYSPFPVRQNPRCKGYDYKTPNYYFVTMCTHEKKWLFGTPGKCNACGNIAHAGLMEINRHFSSVHVDRFVVMPNHVHAIIILSDTSVHLSTVISQYKSFVTKTIHADDPAVCVWQTSYYDHVIRNQQSYEKIWNYIDTNPAKWREDCYMQYEEDAMI